MSLVPLYWIVSQNSGKVLDVIDGSTQVNSRVVQYHKKSSEMCITFKIDSVVYSVFYQTFF